MAAFLTLPESLRLMWWMPPAWYRGGMVIPPSLAVPRWLGYSHVGCSSRFFFSPVRLFFDKQLCAHTYNDIFIYIYTRNLRSFW